MDGMRFGVSICGKQKRKQWMCVKVERILLASVHDLEGTCVLGLVLVALHRSCVFTLKKLMKK